MVWVLNIVGAVLFVGLIAIALTTDTAEVGLDWKFKLQLVAAAFVLGGGLIAYARKIKRNAETEQRLAETVRRNLGLD